MPILHVLHPSTANSTRGSPYNFIVPMIKGQASHTFFHTDIRHWNVLPNSIKEINNSSHFKTAVKKHLFEQARLSRALECNLFLLFQSHVFDFRPSIFDLIWMCVICRLIPL